MATEYSFPDSAAKAASAAKDAPPEFETANSVSSVPCVLKKTLYGIAFALSEIMVVSQVGALANYPFALASYYDLLSQSAFGDFRTLIEEMSLVHRLIIRPSLVLSK